MGLGIISLEVREENPGMRSPGAIQEFSFHKWQALLTSGRAINLKLRPAPAEIDRPGNPSTAPTKSGPTSGTALGVPWKTTILNLTF